MRSYWLPVCFLLSLSSLAQPADTARQRPVAKGYVFSQQELQQMVDLAANPNLAVGNIRTFDRRYEGLQGTPFLWPIWTKGYLALTNGQCYNRGLFKYDVCHQQLLMTQPPMRPDSILIERATVSWFVLQPTDTTSAMLFRHYPDLRSNDADLRTSYYRVLYSGQHSLLQRIHKSFRAANYKDVYSPDIRYDRYIDQSAYYLLAEDQRLTKVKLSTQSLLAVLNVDGLPPPAMLATLRQQRVHSEQQAVQFIQAYEYALAQPK